MLQQGRKRTCSLVWTLLLLLLLFPGGQVAAEVPSLREAYADDFLIGFAARAAYYLDDAINKRHFNAVTAENAMKWESLQPSPGQFNFSAADALVRYAEENDMAVIGHTLVWHSQTPDWVFYDAENNELSREALIERMREHIHTVVGRYKGRIHSWDVVNEAVEFDARTQTWGLRDSKWLQIIGDDFIELAFRFAHEADPEARLIYNDYSATDPGKREAIYAMAQDLLAKGVPIHGIGMQGHWDLTYPPVSQVRTAIELYASLGLSVSVTEMDVSIYSWNDRANRYPNELPEAVAIQQAQVYADYFKLFREYRDVIERVTFWGVKDNHSWKNDFPVRSRRDYPLLFDAQGQPKRAFWAVLEPSNVEGLPPKEPEETKAENLLLKRDVIASHVPERAGRAVDGSELTSWSVNEPPPYWLMVDLGSTFWLERWVVKHEGVGPLASFGPGGGQFNTAAYALQVSSDGEIWEDVDHVVNNKESITDRSFAPVKARYVRLYITEPNSVEGNNHLKIHDFEVWGREYDDLGLVPEPYIRRESYQNYLQRYSGAPSPELDIVIPATAFTRTNMDVQVLQDLPDYDGEALWTDEQGYVEWTVNIPQAGLYSIELEYYPAPGRGTAIEREIMLNGERLFSGAELLTFHRVFGDATPFLQDLAVNEIRPRQVEKPMWRRAFLSDSLGYIMQPYQFYFTEGENKLQLVSTSEPMILSQLRIAQAPGLKPYAEAQKEHESLGLQATSGHFITVQGEDAIYRSSPSLFAVFDQGDPTTQPYHPAEIRLNSIGGHRWQVLGDWIAWEVEIPEDGLYEIAIKGKQNMSRGIFSNRKLLIDGEVPYAELEAIRFNHTNRYQLKHLGLDDQEEPFLFYFTKGTHEIRMEAVLGDLANLVRLSEETLYELNTIYRSIIMITSTTPDPIRSYQLDRRVPNLLDRITAQSEVLKGMAREFEEITGQRGGHTATLTDLARMLDRMVYRPDSIPNLLQEFRDGIGSLGTWVMNTRNQPLQIDYMIVASPGEKMPRVTPTFWQVLLHEVRAFISSFTHDYTGVLAASDQPGEAQQEDPDGLKVWIGLGRDQAQVLKQMIEDTFTPETGIRVNLELVNDMQRLLVPTTIAGTQPDVAIGAASMDLAFRGAVVDLTRFEDFPEVSSRFKKSALLSFRFRDQVFALPEMQSFPMLFYRKDVLADLGLEVPQTWDDVYRILPELQNHHLEFGLWPSYYTFLQFLYQKGVAIFYEDAVQANLEAEAAIATFEEMTNLYTQSGLPLQYNFINRFRMGEMPLAIANYGEFNTLTVFAPELRGEWGMVPIPGVRQEDGTINRTVPVAQDLLAGRNMLALAQGGAGGPAIIIPQGTTGSIIMAKSQKQDEAWEFLKWWTSADTQVRFGREMEALLGAAARYATANVEALQQLPWKVEERNSLNEQWEWVEGIPPVLGGYYITRQFDWLFRAVVLHNEPVRESVIDYSREINREITRKREEFGLETDLEQLDPELKELYWDMYTHVYRLDWDPPEADSRFFDLLERSGIRMPTEEEMQ
ncbi:MAG: extracellular solute-binding protein [Firmicutes bacterium]|nr:extracellular solute-binding protein [Bacillota bacterium]